MEATALFSNTRGQECICFVISSLAAKSKVRFCFYSLLTVACAFIDCLIQTCSLTRNHTNNDSANPTNSIAVMHHICSAVLSNSDVFNQIHCKIYPHHSILEVHVSFRSIDFLPRNIADRFGINPGSLMVLTHGSVGCCPSLFSLLPLGIILQSLLSKPLAQVPSRIQHASSSSHAPPSINTTGCTSVKCETSFRLLLKLQMLDTFSTGWCHRRCYPRRSCNSGPTILSATEEREDKAGCGAEK